MTLRDFVLLVAVCLVWALNNVISKIVIAHMGVPPLFYAAVRFDATPRLTLYAYGSNLTNEIGLTEGNPRAGQIISSEAGSLYGVGRPELGRSFKVAALYRF